MMMIALNSAVTPEQNMFDKLLLCKIMKFFSPVVFLAVLAGCSSLTLTTDPADAEIYVSSPGQSTLNKLNNSPVTMSNEQLSQYADAGLTTFYIRKSGFQETQVIIPNLTGKLEMKIRLRAGAEKSENSDINSIIEKLQDAERFLKTGADQEAVKLADQILQVNGTIASAYLIKAFVLSKQNNKKEALPLLQKSQDLYPNKSVLSLIDAYKKELSGAPK